MFGKSKHVFGFGEPMVDSIVGVDFEFLAKHELVKGSRVLISQETQKLILSGLQIPTLSTGGTTCNTISNLTCLGGKCTFLGKLSDDFAGRFFYQNYINAGIYLAANFVSMQDLSTSTCLIFVTPDGERTMCTYLGASQVSCYDELVEADIAGCQIFYTEVYKLLCQDHVNTVNKGLDYSIKNGVKTVLTCGDHTCVKAAYNTIMSLVDKFDIILGNEFEVPALLQLEADNLDLVCNRGNDFAKKHNVILVMTLASRGSVIMSPYCPTLSIQASQLEKIVDATGAGDSFAAGFITGFIHQLSLEQCGILGTLVATRVISKMGGILNSKDDADFISNVNRNFALSWSI